MVKIADTEKEKNAKRMQGSLNTGNMGFVAMAPLEMAACYQVSSVILVSKKLEIFHSSYSSTKFNCSVVSSLYR